MKSAFLCDNPNNIPRVYSDAVIEKLGINPTVHLVPPKSIARSEGKAVRVIDKRKLV